MADRKSKTVFVRNLPFSATNDQLLEVFGEIGPIKTAFVVKDKESNKCKGYGYIKYSMLEDAVKAQEKVTHIDGRKVFLCYANAKQSQVKQPRLKGVLGEEEEEKQEEKQEKKEEKDVSVKQTASQLFTKTSSSGGRKKHVAKTASKRCRLIIRNLSFKCEEQDLKGEFEKFGEIIEARIPTKPDGKKHGFGFVQFSNLNSARRAIQEKNAKEIKGRIVAVDWAVAKDRFLKSLSENVSPEKQDDEHSDDEGSFSADSDNKSAPQKTPTVLKRKAEDGKIEDNRKKKCLRESSDSATAEEEEMSNDSLGDGESESDEGFSEEKQKKKKKKRHDSDSKFEKRPDVNEGRTLFIRNVPFEAVEDEISEQLQEFGDLVYTRLVVDPETERPKGTAFVQFKTKDAAEKCLSKAQDESKEGGIFLQGRRLLIVLAVSRTEAQNQKKAEKVKEKKDSRNLFLAREGMIRPGTQAAEGISQEDMTKRLRIEQMKRERLKNQNIFVSSTRLCVHNLPTQIDDKQLRRIMFKAAGEPTATITECRVMRDLKRVNAQGVAKSVGYAFVNFTKHDHALQALRNTNNNPDIFGDKKRPIVEFSLENQKALDAKKKKKERCIAKQEMRKLQMAAKSEATGKSQNSFQPPQKRAKIDKGSKEKLLKVAGKDKEQDLMARAQYSGPKGLPKHFGPKIRQRDHKKQKPKSKKIKRFHGVNIISQNGTHVKKIQEQRQPKSTKKMQTKKRKADVDSFDNLVNKYKQKFSQGIRTKWFDS